LKIVKNVTWWELKDILAKREEFRNSTNKFRGAEWTHNVMPSTGQMSTADRVIMERDLLHYGIKYVVWSYATPIGWLRGDGVWYSPSAGYSQTTKTKHLSRLRPAIAELNDRMC
jgi:hypothetical protein